MREERLKHYRPHSRSGRIITEPSAEQRTNLPTAPCWRCGARAGCEHRSDEV